MIEELVTGEVLKNANWKYVWYLDNNCVYAYIYKENCKMVIIVGGLVTEIDIPALYIYGCNDVTLKEKHIRRKVEELRKEDWFKDRYNMEINL